MFFRDHEEVTLKDIFDNARNYLICGTLFAVGAWFRKGAVGLLIADDPSSHAVGQIVGAAFFFIATVLTLLNFVQTFFMVVPAYVETIGGLKEWADKAPPKWKGVANAVRNILDVVDDGVALMIVCGLAMLILYLLATLFRSTKIG